MRAAGKALRCALAALASLLILLAICQFGARLSGGYEKQAILRRVRADSAKLTALAERALTSGDAEAEKPDWVSHAFVSKRPRLVVYEVGGRGLAPEGKSWGFYYSADGSPHPCPGMEGCDQLPVMFGFRWEEPGARGDNGCYAEHIEGGLYYFEEWW